MTGCGCLPASVTLVRPWPVFFGGTMKIQIRNEYHGTAVNCIVGADMRLSHHQVLRARRELCGLDGCTCGGIRDRRVTTYRDSWGRWEGQIDA